MKQKLRTVKLRNVISPLKSKETYLKGLIHKILKKQKLRILYQLQITHCYSETTKWQIKITINPTFKLTNRILDWSLACLLVVIPNFLAFVTLSYSCIHLTSWRNPLRRQPSRMYLLWRRQHILQDKIILQNQPWMSTERVHQRK